MKAAFLISLLIAQICIALSADMPDIKSVMKTCMAESKVTEDEMKSLHVTDSTSEPSKNLQCHVKCVMEKMGHFKDGVFDADKSLKDWKDTPEAARKISDPSVFAKCKNEKGANDCETAYKIGKCIRQGKTA